MTSKKTVQIACTTFNHQDYIRSALDGFLSQKTDFTFEAIVNDDCSTDGTTAIVKSYEKQSSGTVRGLFHDTNQWSQGIHPWFDTIFPSLDCEFIALCDGDDYWVDPEKLQIQINYMRENPSCGLCHHKVEIHNTASNAITYNTIRGEGKLAALAEGNFIFTSSVLLRTAAIDLEMLQRLSKQVPLSDYMLFLSIARKWDIGYIDKVMSVYRLNSNGVWGLTSRSNQLFKTLVSVKHMIALLDKKTEAHRIMKKQISDLRHELNSKYRIEFIKLQFKYWLSNWKKDSLPQLLSK